MEAGGFGLVSGEPLRRVRPHACIPSQAPSVHTQDPGGDCLGSGLVPVAAGSGDEAMVSPPPQVPLEIEEVIDPLVRH